MKKQNKKNTKKNRYNGTNIFGERCHARTIKLLKETALEQVLDTLDKVDSFNGKIEYTFDWSAMSSDEAWEVQRKLNRIVAFRKYNSPIYCA